MPKSLYNSILLNEWMFIFTNVTQLCFFLVSVWGISDTLVYKIFTWSVTSFTGGIAMAHLK